MMYDGCPRLQTFELLPADSHLYLKTRDAVKPWTTIQITVSYIPLYFLWIFEFNTVAQDPQAAPDHAYEFGQRLCGVRRCKVLYLHPECTVGLGFLLL